MKSLRIIVLAVTLTGLLLMTGCGAQGASADQEQKALYKDGSYEGAGKGIAGEVKVKVQVTGGNIAGVTILSHQESEGIGTVAAEKMPEKIVTANSPEVEVVSGATVTSHAIMEAVRNALEGAK